MTRTAALPARLPRGAETQAVDAGQTQPVCWRNAASTFSVQHDGRTLEVAVFRSVESLTPLRDEWNRIAIQSAPRSGFLTWEWLVSWSMRFIRGERALFVVAIAEGTRIIGIAPWYVGTTRVDGIRTREIGFLGIPELGSDYLDVLTRRGKERIVAATLLSLLYGALSSEWDTFTLREIPAESVFLVRFIAELKRAGKHYGIEEGSFCPTVDLPATFDACLAGMSAHARHAFRRELHVLRRTGRLELAVMHGECEVRSVLPALRELYEKRWGTNAASEDLFRGVDAYLAMAAGAWDVQVSLLRLDDRPIAGLLHLTSGRVMYQFLMAIDRTVNPSISLGHVMCGLNIEHAIAERFTEYDFLKSDEDYKLRFATRGRRAVSLLLHNGNARAFASFGARAARQIGKVLLR